mgnify:CR=1 FL=1
MRERPILFSAEMVKAILEGKKTQTRRVIRNPGRYDNIRGCDFCCPFGQVGDLLWCRETWNLIETLDGRPVKVVYRASPETYTEYLSIHWRPSIFMPRWASRILLEITSIKVKRLQEITPSDIEAEGHRPFAYPDSIQELSSAWAYSWYRNLWDSLNGKKYPWASNPWVWCISFKRLAIRKEG